jgi:hypothetical protein
MEEAVNLQYNRLQDKIINEFMKNDYIIYECGCSHIIKSDRPHVGHPYFRGFCVLLSFVDT